MATKINCNKNGKDYYRVSISLGRGSDGKTIRKEFYGKGKKEAEEKRDEYLLGIKNGLNKDFNKISLGELIHTWLFEMVRVSNRIKPSTFQRYEGIYRNYIENSQIYGLSLVNIKSLHIQRYYNILNKNDKSSNVIYNLNKLLRNFFNYAVDEHYMISNPCSGKKVSIPGIVEKKEKEIKVFTEDEIKLFKVVLQDHRLKVLFLLDFATGLRLGELLGLKWSDIELDKCLLHVNRNIKQVNIISEDGSKEYKTIEQIPKTKKSLRTIPIPENMISLLKEHLNQQKCERIKAGPAYTKSDYVFTTELGKIIIARNLTKTYKRLLDKSKIEYKNFHSIRHTYATKLFEAGEDLKTVSELLGHSNISTTANIYTHVSENKKYSAAEKINYLFN